MLCGPVEIIPSISHLARIMHVSLHCIACELVRAECAYSVHSSNCILDISRHSRNDVSVIHEMTPLTSYCWKLHCSPRNRNQYYKLRLCNKGCFWIEIQCESVIEFGLLPTKARHWGMRPLASSIPIHFHFPAVCKVWTSALFIRECSSRVTVVTRLGAGAAETRVPAPDGCGGSLRCRLHTGLGVKPIACQMGTATISPLNKAVGAYTYTLNSPPKVMTACRYTFVLLYAVPGVVFI
jgi:hypothetical protein